MFTTTKLNYKNYKLTAAITSIVGAVVVFLSFYIGKNEFFLFFNGDFGKPGDFFFTYGTHAGDGLLWIVWLAAIFYTKRKHLLPLIISSFLLSTIFTQIGKQVILPDELRPLEALKVETFKLQEADYLQTINGVPVVTLYDMFVEINKANVGDPIVATFIRAGKTDTINTTLSNDLKVHLIKGVDVHSYSSFPSGHTATAFTFALLISLLIRSKGLIMLCIVAALLVGYSRIYLSQHFPLDVAAGMIVAVTSVTLSLFIQKWFDKRRHLKYTRTNTI